MSSDKPLSAQEFRKAESAIGKWLGSSQVPYIAGFVAVCAGLLYLAPKIGKK